MALECDRSQCLNLSETQCHFFTMAIACPVGRVAMGVKRKPPREVPDTQ